MINKLLIVYLLLLLALLKLGHAIDEEGAKEQGCFEVKTVAADPHWFQSVKTWYYPLMSRLDIYRTLIEMTKLPLKDIKESELYYDSCIEFTTNVKGMFVGSAYGGKARREYAHRPRDPSWQIFDFGGGPEDLISGYCAITMTDNKTYILSACCTNGSQMHWGVLSPLKSLPAEIKKKLHDHAEFLGFKKEYFTELRYDFCDKNVTAVG